MFHLEMYQAFFQLLLRTPKLFRTKSEEKLSPGMTFTRLFPVCLKRDVLRSLIIVIEVMCLGRLPGGIVVIRYRMQR